MIHKRSLWSLFQRRNDRFADTIGELREDGREAGRGDGLGAQRRESLRGKACAAVLALLSTGLAAQAQSTFPAQAIGTPSASVSVTVTAKQAGTVSTVRVLTGGAPNLEFVAGSGTSTCAGAALNATSTCVESVVFTPAFPGLRTGAVVLLDSSGNVLGTALLSGTGVGSLGVLIPANMVTVAGVSRTWTSTLDGIPATSANLDQPTGTVMDGAGNLYIADGAHNKIRMVAAPVAPALVGIISTYAGTGDSGYTGDGGAATSASFNAPAGLAIDGAGNLYIADSLNNVVRKITAATGIVSTVAGNGTQGFGGDNGAATAAELNFPWGVTVDANGNLYIADTGNQRIRRVDAATGMIVTVAGNGAPSAAGDGKGTYSGDGGPATLAGLSLPYATALDGAGNLYIADSANHRIRKVNGSGTIGTFTGTGQAGYSGDGQAATAADLNTPSSVAVDAAGNVYIADTQNAAVRKVNGSSGIIGTAVGNSAGAKLDLNGNLASPNLYAPIAMYLDGAGNLYFSDYFEMVVLKLTAAMAVLDYRAVAVRQSDKSEPQTEAVENDGNAPLDLTQLQPGANAALDSGTTTCVTGNPYLAVGGTCNIGAVFAPTVSGNPLRGDLDIDNASVNTPLDIALIGNATPVNSTTVVLTSSPSPSDFGQAVTFTATVTTGANTGNLTGTVTFSDGTTNFATGVAVNAAGVATYTLSTLTVGSHSITAAYSGDTGHFASTSAPALIQVVDESTAVGVTSSANPSAAGGNATFTATVTTPNGGGVTPDGTVTFFDGATLLGSATLNASATATYSTTTLSNGPHAIVAVYGGDTGKYILGSTSAPWNQDVLAASTVAMIASANPSTYGLAVTFAATVSSAGPTATGAVKFFDGAQQIGAANLTGAPATASFTISALAVGAHTITASYAGDLYNGPGTSAALTETIVQTQTSLTEAALPNPGIAGAPVAIAATLRITTGAGTPTGTIGFADGTTSLGSVSLASGGTATIHSMLGPGAHSIVATYSGDTDDAGSSSSPLALNVQQATTATALASAPNPSLVLSAIAFTAKVTSDGGIPTGSVAFVADNTTLGIATLDATGTATFSSSNLAVGSHSIVASYAGDGNDLPSSSPPITQTVQTIPTVTDLGSSTTTGPTPQLILVATVLGNTGPTPTGIVTFSTGTATIGVAPLDSSGVATLTPNLASGAYPVVATYSGDALHSPSASQPTQVTSPAQGFNIAVTPSSVTLATTQNATVSVSLSSVSGFADTIGLGCASLPAGVNCHFAHLQTALASNSSATVQLTIDTNSPLSGGASAMNAKPANRTMLLAGFIFPLPVLFGWAWRRWRKRHLAAFTAMVLLWLGSGAMLLSGCSGYSQSSAAPGTYTFEVVGVGVNSNITHYQNVTLTVTK